MIWEYNKCPKCPKRPFTSLSVWSSCWLGDQLIFFAWAFVLLHVDLLILLLWFPHSRVTKSKNIPSNEGRSYRSHKVQPQELQILMLHSIVQMNPKDSEGHWSSLFAWGQAVSWATGLSMLKPEHSWVNLEGLDVLDSPNSRVEKIDSTFARERKGHIIEKQKELI